MATTTVILCAPFARSPRISILTKEEQRSKKNVPHLGHVGADGEHRRLEGLRPVCADMDKKIEIQWQE